jgi:tetratricopeptide (TPR) repeat protein
MRKLVVILFLAFSYLSFAENIPEFNAANILYNTGQYSKAIEAYKAIVDKGTVSSNLYLNLGNSYFKLNKIADAIINYERAIKLSPSDEDIIFNLKVANTKIVDKIDPAPKFFITEWIDNVMGVFTSGGWGWLVVLSFWIAAGLFLTVLFVFKGQMKRIVFVASIAFVFLAIGFWVIAFTKYSAETNNNFGVIYNESVYVKASPDEKSTDLFILHEGTKSEILNTLNEWVQIKLQNGNVGWIAINDIVRI